MKRAQRKVHATIWPLIALIMAATLVAAVVAREHPAPHNTAPPPETR